MKQVLNLHLKDGTERTIVCDWFTMTSVNVLLVTNNGEKEEFENVEWFGGWPNED